MSAPAKLFTPLTVAGVELANRVVMPSMGSNLADSRGRVTDQMAAYYQARAAGRPGLMVVEAACVHPSGRVIERHLMNHDPGVLPGLQRLAQAVAEHQVPAVLQLIHGGRNSHPRLVGELLAPSPLKGPISKMAPRAMTRLEIEGMVECFARAAERAVAAGFAGVEIHAAHEYLVHQFLSPCCNARTDEYGGDLARRARFALDIARAVRQAMGRDHLLIFRISGADYVRRGMDPEMACEVAVMLEHAGADVISVTGGVYETPHMVVPPLPMPPGTHLAAAVQIRRRISLPVVGVGRIANVEQAQAALEKVDLVACGRAFLADPDWLAKSRQGRPDLIRPCIGCNQGCIDRVLEGLPVTCVANPWVGREGEQMGLAAVRRPARVAVVGGGLAGMEAAETLGRLGHHVTLLERGPRLGGQVRFAAVPPGKAEFLKLAVYYENSLAQLDNVDIRLNTKATTAAVCQLAPQAVVVATGSEPVLPQIPGAKQAPVVSAREVLAGTAKVGRRVAVLGGGNLGSEVAHHLARQGREVCIIELGLGIGSDLGPARRYLLRRELSEFKVKRYMRSMVRRLYQDRVSFLHTLPDGTRQPTDVGPLDTFVAALGNRPQEELYLALESKVAAIYLVGDAMSPARMGDATSEGLGAALDIHRRAVEGALEPSRAAAC